MCCKMSLPTLTSFHRLIMASKSNKPTWCDFYDDEDRPETLKLQTASRHSEIEKSNSLGQDGQSYRQNCHVPSANGIQKGNTVPSSKASPMNSSSLGISKVLASLVNNEPKPLSQPKMSIDVKEKTESVKLQTKGNCEDLEYDIPLSARSKMSSDHVDNDVVVLSSGDSDDDDDTNPLSGFLFRNYNLGTCSSNYDHSVHKKPISKVQKVSQNGSGANKKQEKPSTLLGKRPLDKSNFLHSSVEKSMVSESDPAASTETKRVSRERESDDGIPISQIMKKQAKKSKRSSEGLEINKCGSPSYKRQAKKSKRSSEGLEYSKLSADCDLKVKELASVKKSIEECQMKRQAEQQRLRTLERDIEECSKELETKKKQVASIQEQLNSMNKQFEGQMMELESKEKQLEGRVKELKSKEEHLEGWEKDLKSEEKQVDKRVKDLVSREKQAEVQVNELNSKKKQFKRQVKGLQFKEKLFKVQVKELKSKERQFEGQVKDLESKEKQFEDRVKELESKENKFEVLVKELNLKKKQFEGQVTELKFKEEQFEVQVKELKSKEKHFERQVKYFESQRNQYEGQQKEVELKENQYEVLVKSFEEQKVPDKQLSPSTDGRSLQLLSNVQTNETELIIDNDVLVNLKTSSDPAKLVLDIVQNPIVPQCRKEGDVVIVNRYQIFLLEQLMRLSPNIEPHVRDEAMKLALDLKANIRASTENSMVVLGFLLLLSIYGLVSYFNEDEVLKVFEFAAQHKQAVELFRTLGFEDKVSDFVQSLIQNQQHIEAVGFICAFKLVYKYQPVDLLREYMQNERLIYESSYKNVNSIEIKVKAIDQEIASLENVLQCISDNSIESQDLHEEIQDRILELESQKANSSVSTGIRPCSKSATTLFEETC